MLYLIELNDSKQILIDNIKKQSIQLHGLIDKRETDLINKLDEMENEQCKLKNNIEKKIKLQYKELINVKDQCLNMFKNAKIFKLNGLNDIDSVSYDTNAKKVIFQSLRNVKAPQQIENIFLKHAIGCHESTIESAINSNFIISELKIPKLNCTMNGAKLQFAWSNFKYNLFDKKQLMIDKTMCDDEKATFSVDVNDTSYKYIPISTVVDKIGSTQKCQSVLRCFANNTWFNTNICDIIIPKIFRYQSDFDNNGIIYWLGTNKGRNSEWVNPVGLNLIKIDSSQMGGGKAQYFVEHSNISRSNWTNETSNDKDNYFMIDFGNYSILPIKYSLRHHNESGGYLRNWELKGSTKSDTYWHSIKKHIDDTSINNAHGTSSWDIDTNTYYSKFKIQLTREPEPPRQYSYDSDDYYEYNSSYARVNHQQNPRFYNKHVCNILCLYIG